MRWKPGNEENATTQIIELLLKTIIFFQSKMYLVINSYHNILGYSS